MRKRNLKVSPKHGLNPSIEKCPVCGKEMGIVLYGRLKGDIEAPKYSEQNLCDECKVSYLTLLEANPTTRKPTGRRLYIKREFINERFRKEDFLLMKEEDFNETLKLIDNPSE